MVPEKESKMARNKLPGGMVFAPRSENDRHWVAVCPMGQIELSNPLKMWVVHFTTAAGKSFSQYWFFNSQLEALYFITKHLQTSALSVES